MNAGIDASTGRYVLAVNPDCRLEPDFASILARRLDAKDAADVGSASGRLLRGDGVHLSENGLLDSTGIYFTAAGRHFDRGSGESAAGRYGREEEVFGASGAAGFYRRAALESAKISTGYFDSDFFLYREDADLAWRLRRLGWRALYVPSAVAYHRRRNVPERRRQMTALANLHSVKNRFVLRINNQTPGEFVRTFIPTFARDLVVVGACLTVERSSLPAFGWLWRNRKRLWAKRREIREMVAGRRPSPRPSPRLRGRGRLAGSPLPGGRGIRVRGRPPAIASLPHAHRHPRHPRHPRALRRLRDARRGAVGAASRRAGTTSRSTRAPATRSRAFASGAARRSACCRRSRRSTSTRSCTVSCRASTPRSSDSTPSSSATPSTRPRRSCRASRARRASS